MTNLSRMSLIMNLLGLEQLELFTLELDLVYTLASTNIKQSGPNCVKIYMTIRSCVRSFMGGIGVQQHELFALQFHLVYLTWFSL